MWLAFAPAFAGTVLITDEPEPAARSALTDRGLSADGVAVRRLPDLRAYPPFLDGAGRVWGCGSVPGTAIDERLTVAEQAIRDHRLLEADDALDDALALAVCRDRVDVAELWRVYLLEGVVATNQQDPERAKAAFRTARALDPARPWDDQLPDGRDAFDQAAEPLTAEIRLSIVPEDVGEVEVDGHPAVRSGRDVLLAPGTHFLRLGTSAPRVVRLAVEGRGAATLVLPSLLPEELPTWAGDPARWPDLGTVLRELVPEPDVTTWDLSGDDRVWVATDASGPWQEVPSPPAPPPPAPPVPSWAKDAGIVAAIGLAATGGCAIGAVDAARRAEDVRTGPYDAWAQAQTELKTWQLCVAASGGVAGTGAVFTVGGLLWGRR
jgi:hypothetical protein